jgi:hypothetical protein
LRLALFFEGDLLNDFVHFLNLLVVHNFRCAHRQGALAERANLLAKRARSSGARWRPYLIETMGLSKALGFYDMAALPSQRLTR